MATNSPLKQSAIVWGVTAVALSVLSCTFNNSPLVLSASLLTKILAVCAGSVTGTAFALIGDALRRAVRPDAIITSGGFFNLLGARLFWAIGPQSIGLCVGVVLAMVLVLR